MFGYFTSPDEGGGNVFATWALAKIAEADEAEIERRLAAARRRLKQATIFGPTQGGASG
jgi:hypothetical protein